MRKCQPYWETSGFASGNSVLLEQDMEISPAPWEEKGLECLFKCSQPLAKQMVDRIAPSIGAGWRERKNMKRKEHTDGRRRIGVNRIPLPLILRAFLGRDWYPLPYSKGSGQGCFSVSNTLSQVPLWKLQIQLYGWKDRSRSPGTMTDSPISPCCQKSYI